MGRAAMTILIFLALIGAAAVLQGCATLSAEKHAPPIGRVIEIEGQRLHVLDLGPSKASAPPVVLIHGASVNLRDMKIALGDRLAQSRRVIMIDRPGRGYSTRPGDGWKLGRQAELIHAALAELGVERPVILGQSFGGAVALAYARAYHDEMTGLVLLAPVSHEWPGGVAWYNNVSGWPVAGFLLRRMVIPLYAPLAAKSGVEKSFAPDEAPPNYYEEAGVALLFRPGDFKSNASDLRHLKSEVIAMSGGYAVIQVPTAILAGENDTTVSPRIHAMALAREIPGASLEMFPDTGHAIHHAETAAVLRAIDAVSAAGGS